MKKQVIHFDNTGYTEATKALDEAIETINKHSQELTTNGYLLTIEDIKLIADRDNKFNKKVYSSQLKDICNTLGLTIIRCVLLNIPLLIVCLVKWLMVNVSICIV